MDQGLLRHLLVMMAVFLVPCDSSGNGLAEYRWKSVVLSQIPMLSEVCVREFQNCFNSTYTFEELLFDHEDERRRMCQQGLSCLQNSTTQANKKTCSIADILHLEKFLCYIYDVSDNETPPISISCTLKYWECSIDKLKWLDTIPVSEKNRLCGDRRFDFCNEYKMNTNYLRDMSEMLWYLCYKQQLIFYCEDGDFNLYKLFAGMTSSETQPELCSDMELCFDSSTNCSPAEKMLSDQFMCADVDLTPDIYNLFLISDSCKDSFRQCSKYTIENVTNNLEMRRDLCLKRDKHFNDCLEWSGCSDMEHTVYFHYQMSFGKFLCFNPDNPIMLISNACTRNFINCYIIPTEEGFSYLEMNDTIHLKKELCKIKNQKVKCMKTFRLGYNRGCSRDELDIISDYLCGSDESDLFPGGDTEYKWTSIVQSQIPIVSKSCMREFHDCYNFNHTFEELLFDHNDERKQMCKAKHDKGIPCLKDAALQSDRETCSITEISHIERFICYEYNASDDKVPPVSKNCALRYVLCSADRLNFLQKIQEEHRNSLCEKEVSELPYGYDGYENYYDGFWEILEYFCDRNASHHPHYYEKFVTKVIANLYSKNINLFEALADMKSVVGSQQLSLCSHQEECLVASYDSPNDCSLAEAKAVNQFMCSHHDVTPDIYGLYLVSDNCTEAFYRCSYLTISDIINDMDTRKILCRTRDTSFRECLKPCVYQTDEILSHYLHPVDMFLCFSPDEPILLVSNACTQNFIHCYNITNEGFSYLEMDDFTHLKGEFCNIQEDNKKCMETQLWHYHRGCSPDELAIISDFLCESDDNRNELHETSFSYKWMPVVQSQIPTLSQDCLMEFYDCYDLYNYTLEELLYDSDGRRGRLCKHEYFRNRCLPPSYAMTNTSTCSLKEIKQIQKFVCYKYNATDNELPPIDKSCSMHYVLCNTFHLRFLEKMPDIHRNRLCHDVIFNRCYPHDTYYDHYTDIMEVTNYLCDTDVHSRPVDSKIVVIEFIILCYGQFFDMFTFLADMKSADTDTRPFLCSYQEECLTSDNELHPDLLCTSVEIVTLDRFMCSDSDVSFTPDIYGLYMISDHCKDSFHQCSSHTISDLTNDFEMRRELCKTRDKHLRDCLEKSSCDNVEQESQYHYQRVFGNFLCFSPDDPILLISNACTRNFLKCYILPSEEGFFYLEMNHTRYLKNFFCGNMKMRSRDCMETFQLGYDRGCSQDELKTISDFLCVSDENDDDTDDEVDVIVPSPPDDVKHDLSQYKWISIVQSQIPVVLPQCVAEFYHCYDVTFEELLFNYSDTKRKRMCTGGHTAIACLHGGDTGHNNKMCSLIEILHIKRFLCYQYDSREDKIPPISNTCALRYMQCNKDGLQFMDTISDEHKTHLCEKDIFDLCYENGRYNEYHYLLLELLAYMCGPPTATQQRPAFSDKTVVEIIGHCYGENFNLFEALAATKSNNTQPYLCSYQEECLVTMYDSPNDCSLAEAKTVGQFMCSNDDVTVTQDMIYGLHVVSDNCKDSFHQCTNYTISDIASNLERRRWLCETRDMSYTNCLNESQCTDRGENIQPLLDFERAVGKFLCFSKDDPILLISDACMQMYKYCCDLPTEGFSYLERSDFQAKTHFCILMEDNKKCLEMSSPYSFNFNRGCSQDELKIVSDYLLCKSSENGQEVFHSKGMDELAQYKWLSIAQSQIPTVSKDCVKHFQDCTNLNFTLEELLFDYDYRRREMCGLRELSKCWQYPFMQTDRTCSVMEFKRIETFLCYEYNWNDDEIPPISTDCAVAYWQCSQVQLNFLERIPAIHKEMLCRLECFRDKQYSSENEVIAMRIQNYFCNQSVEGFSLSDPRESRVFFDLKNCYGEHFNLFQILADMKSESEQPYLCFSRQKECLESKTGTYSMNGFGCTRAETEVLDQFMCSNTSFTPDIYNIFLVRDQCKDAFRQCTKHNISDLMNDLGMRKDLCREIDSSLIDCLEKSQCNDFGNYKYISDFLCFGPDDPILMVTDACANQFFHCHNLTLKNGFSDLEMTHKTHLKGEFCKMTNATKACMGYQEHCTDKEVATIGKFLCVVSSSCKISRVASMMVGLCVWMTTVAMFMDDRRVFLL